MIVSYALLATAVIAAAVAAMKSADLIHSAVALCLGNSALAALFFLLRAPYAGSVQLSVGAGVLSALFIIAISLTETVRGVPGDE
jgi:NADH:ubiquinone oxidoreductase subunit 6 (subunit J)